MHAVLALANLAGKRGRLLSSCSSAEPQQCCHGAGAWSKVATGGSRLWSGRNRSDTHVAGPVSQLVPLQAQIQP